MKMKNRVMILSLVRVCWPAASFPVDYRRRRRLRQPKPPADLPCPLKLGGDTNAKRPRRPWWTTGPSTAGGHDQDDGSPRNSLFGVSLVSKAGMATLISK